MPDAQNKQQRPALRRGQAACAAPAQPVEQAVGKSPKWRLNSGALMQTYVEGLGRCALIIDLETASFEASEIPMLREHDTWYGPIGRWASLSVDATGIYGEPIVYTPNTPAEQDMPCLRQGGEVAALMARKHPWQASVLASSPLSDYERVLPGQSAVVNGQTITASDDLEGMPLFIARNSVISEASICLFGADADTGAVAAAALKPTPNPEAPMTIERLNVLLKRHGNKHAAAIAVALSAGKTDEVIAAELSDATDADHKAQLAAKDAELAKANEALTAEKTKVTDLQAKLDALKEPTTEEEKVPEAGKGESKNAAPKTIPAGMALLRAQGSKLSGFKLRSAALTRWPALREGLPKV